jgi:hypothetical protein
MDLNTATMTTNITQEDILNIPNVSITEMTTKDFDNEYHGYIHQDDYDQTLKCTSINVITDDDDDDDDDEK